MQNPRKWPESKNAPDVLLILGSDASGKNHVANVAAEMIAGSGYKVEKREGWFSKKASEAITSEGKSDFDLLIEKFFISTVPLTRFVMSIVLSVLIRWDMSRFKKTDRKIIVISHTPVRVLAFFLGHMYGGPQCVVLPSYLHNSLRAIEPATGAKTLVLDIDDEIRKKRFAKRQKNGQIDQFDRYMAKDGVLSERIEDLMIWLAKTYLAARKLTNNDHCKFNLEKQLAEAFSAFEASSAP